MTTVERVDIVAREHVVKRLLAMYGWLTHQDVYDAWTEVLVYVWRSGMEFRDSDHVRRWAFVTTRDRVMKRGGDKAARGSHGGKRVAVTCEPLAAWMVDRGKPGVPQCEPVGTFIGYASMTGRQREVCELVVDRSFTLTESAALLGLTFGAARSAYTKGIARARRVLGKEVA